DGGGAQLGPLAQVLPFLEQDALYRQTKAGMYPQTTLKMFMDPSDTTVGFVNTSNIVSYWPGVGAMTRYVYIDSPLQSESSNSDGIWSGSESSFVYNGGPSASSSISAGKQRSMTQIFADGTSNTLLAGERVAGCSTGGY